MGRHLVWGSLLTSRHSDLCCLWRWGAGSSSSHHFRGFQECRGRLGRMTGELCLCAGTVVSAFFLGRWRNPLWQNMKICMTWARKLPCSNMRNIFMVWLSKLPGSNNVWFEQGSFLAQIIIKVCKIWARKLPCSNNKYDLGKETSSLKSCAFS